MSLSRTSLPSCEEQIIPLPTQPPYQQHASSLISQLTHPILPICLLIKCTKPSTPSLKIIHVTFQAFFTLMPSISLVAACLAPRKVLLSSRTFRPWLTFPWLTLPWFTFSRHVNHDQVQIVEKVAGSTIKIKTDRTKVTL